VSLEADREEQALHNIIQAESGGNCKAQNPHSTAYGLFQFLDSTWKGTGIAKTSNCELQMIAGKRYIQQRYGTAVEAWKFWQLHRWY
jgi:SLT domain-containing protein